MQNKRGQFYLLAAIVLIAVIIGFAAASNYSKKKPDSRLMDLGDELGIEGGNVLEHGVYLDKDMEILLGEFSGEYDGYAGADKEIVFIMGVDDRLIVLTYEEVSAGDICVGSFCDPQDFRTPGKIITELDSPFEITFGGVDYSFDLKPGQNFYFVLAQETDGEKYVVTG